MGLSELLAARVYTLRVDELLEGSELSDADREVFAQALRDPRVPSTRISGAMKKLGVSCSRTTIDNWRDANGVNAG